MGDLLSAHTQPLAAQAWGLCMRGRVRSQERCPVCGKSKAYRIVDHGRGRRALVCACGQSEAKLPEIDLRWQGKRYSIIYDQRGDRFPSLAHAERALEVIRSQIDAQTFDPAMWTGKQSNELLWENYLASYLQAEERRCSPATFAKKRALSRHLAWFQGQNVREIRTGHLEDFFSRPCLGLALSPKTLADLASELRHLFRRAVAREDIARAPQVPTVAVPETKIKYLSLEAQERALEAMPAHHRPIFLFLMQYGCRPSEACALCWDMVDRDNQTVTLARGISRRRLAQRTKTGRVNELPIMGAFATWLERAPIGWGELPVFTNPEARTRARWYTPDALRVIWQAALASAGLEYLPLKNGTRHSAAMRRLAEGWSLAMIARLLGHTSEIHTRKYARADTEMLRDAMNDGGKLEVINFPRKPTV